MAQAGSAVSMCLSAAQGAERTATVAYLRLARVQVGSDEASSGFAKSCTFRCGDRREPHLTATRPGRHAGNSRHVQTLLLVCAKLFQFLGERPGNRPEAEQMPLRSRNIEVPAVDAVVFTVNDFLFASGLDDVNMFRLTRCAQHENCAHEFPTDHVPR